MIPNESLTNESLTNESLTNDSLTSRFTYILKGTPAKSLKSKNKLVAGGTAWKLAQSYCNFFYENILKTLKTLLKLWAIKKKYCV
jgi:hypothetical protein